MKSQLPYKAKLYIVSLLVAAASLSYFLVIRADWSGLNWVSLCLFLFLTVLADSFPVEMPHGGVVSVGFALLFASVLLFEPFSVVLITVLGDALSLRKGRSLYKYLFNASQLAIALGTASLVYRLINEGSTIVSVNSLYGIIAALVCCFILNSFFVTVILALVQQKNPYSLWLINIKWSAPSYLGMAPLGILIALIYDGVGILGLALYMVPLLLARHSFQSYMDMRKAFLDTIQSLSAALDAKDPYTRGHASRVAGYAEKLAREMKWPEDRVEQLQYMALIHDVGKIAIPEYILKKEANLTDPEFQEMEQHSVVGAEIIKNIRFFAEGAGMIRHHHERWDGSGYPARLQREQIPAGARILAVADAFDAMTSNRPYRSSRDPDKALQELQKGAGTQFDPGVVEAFTRIFPRLEINLEFCYPIKITHDEQAACDPE